MFETNCEVRDDVVLEPCRYLFAIFSSVLGCSTRRAMSGKSICRNILSGSRKQLGRKSGYPAKISSEP